MEEIRSEKIARREEKDGLIISAVIEKIGKDTNVSLQVMEEAGLWNGGAQYITQNDFFSMQCSKYDCVEVLYNIVIEKFNGIIEEFSL